MNTTFNLIAFPENIIEQKCKVKLEALTINLPSNIIIQIDRAIEQIKTFPKSFFITYRITESDIHKFAKLQIAKSRKEIEIVHLQIQAQQDLLMAHIFANVGDLQDQYWFVELRHYSKSLTEY